MFRRTVRSRLGAVVSVKGSILSSTAPRIISASPLYISSSSRSYSDYAGLAKKRAKAFEDGFRLLHETAKAKNIVLNEPNDLLQLLASDEQLLRSFTKISEWTEKMEPPLSGKPVRVAVTGAAGAIGYSLLFRIASGAMLGTGQPVILQCLEVPQALKALEGVVMELSDCAFPLLHGITATDDPEKAFEGADFALLVGAQPRTKGMDRADLLKKNADIFAVQGKALNKVANRGGLKVLVVGNPANTNCLIASANAPNISPRQFSAMTRLDHNRGLAQLALKLGCKISDIERFAVWGNHSDSQFPDLSHTLVKGKWIRKDLDDGWINNEFIPTVAKRGAAVIAARGKSSAASAANAAIEQMRDWALGSGGQWVSMGVWTGSDPQKTPYGTSPDIFYSFPVVCENGDYGIVCNVPIEPAAQARLQATNDELVSEKNAVGELALRK